MDENRKRTAAKAERRLKEIPHHLLGPAGRILLSNSPPPTKRGAGTAPLRSIEGRRTERQSPSQRSLLGEVRSD